MVGRNILFQKTNQSTWVEGGGILFLQAKNRTLIINQWHQVLVVWHGIKKKIFKTKYSTMLLLLQGK